MPTKQTPIEQANALRSRFIGTYNRKFTRAFTETSEHLGVSLQKVINNKIDESLKDMAKYKIFGGEHTPPALIISPEPATPWSNLSDRSRYTKQKSGQNMFFRVTGDMQKQLEAIQNVHRILGGYNPKNKKVGNGLVLPKGYTVKEGLVLNKSGKTVGIQHIQTTLQFSVFSKLDAAINAHQETEIFGGEKNLNYKFLGRPSEEHTGPQRDILKSYYAFYTHVVLPNTIDAFLHKRKRK